LRAVAALQGASNAQKGRKKGARRRLVGQKDAL